MLGNGGLEIGKQPDPGSWRHPSVLALTRIGVGLLAATGIGLTVLWFCDPPSTHLGMEAMAYGILWFLAGSFAGAITIPLIYAGFGVGPLTRVERKICIALGLVCAAPAVLMLTGAVN